MGKHHTEDYKLFAVKYALQTGNQIETMMHPFTSWKKIDAQIPAKLRV